MANDQISNMERATEVYAPNSPLLPLIRKDAAELQAKRGQEYAIAGNMVVTLGGDQ